MTGKGFALSLGLSKQRKNLVAAVALDVAHEDTTPW
jgi:hypothetical protein